ncbi:bifunctional DNA-formamidopyrimidine glycosylase/DNA-(apurinic or apyrimidinic site) lyase [Canibacter sp. lx-72]|uniref:bifunctional DNA-formamidopyrimidine glycosylase/DNA-(apurinic or apyrimidinic site) lyase n=1 Tax=Canibacter zhuwentaonis TaxID=2837491 RepID=UPI001BDD95D3|nr:bifunctional DNA-formamidopyrimidine glycosylase/DNA-(apurinic or apyrimidinic site) lyase [Canibacter zhuwentaonis]MBT1018193.1 bifunctional DNA-formamidopyrimidine glycosylase/DNA-(apurinic or apyrimidinic site) lyase [Canibacter zhuwentaonis]
MPELPEVEVVRAGLQPAVTGARVLSAKVFDARSLKRHISLTERNSGQLAPSHGRTLDAATQSLRAADFEQRITGVKLAAPVRRGKFLWIPIADSPQPHTALFAHLAMSGQLLLRAPDAPDDKHVRIRILLESAAGQLIRLDFADQRRFGSLAIDPLVPTADGRAAGWGDDACAIPAQAAHIARDLLDAEFDFARVAARLKLRNSAIKKLLLEQQLCSGIGNIYADEALWEAAIHPELRACRISVVRLRQLLAAAADVMARALIEGGTSFDAQYVNVNGEAGYFVRSLNAYGRAGEPCKRCGEIMRLSNAIGRASHYCPRCQRKR